jgi:hypothetical protein
MIVLIGALNYGLICYSELKREEIRAMAQPKAAPFAFPPAFS